MSRQIDSGSLTVISCRPKKETIMPHFNSDDIVNCENYFKQDFYVLFELMKNNVEKKQLNGYNLEDCKILRLKRVVLTVLLEKIETQLNSNYTIQPLEYYSFVQIHATNVIPFSCVISLFKTKIVELQNRLINITTLKTSGFTMSVIEKTTFLTCLKNRLEAYSFNLEYALKSTTLIKTNLMFDLVVLTAGIVALNERDGILCKKFYEGVMHKT